MPSAEQGGTRYVAGTRDAQRHLAKLDLATGAEVWGKSFPSTKQSAFESAREKKPAAAY